MTKPSIVSILHYPQHPAANLLKALGLFLYCSPSTNDSCGRYLVSKSALSDEVVWDGEDTFVLKFLSSRTFVKTSQTKHWLSFDQVWEAIIPLNVRWETEEDIRHECIRRFFIFAQEEDIAQATRSIYSLPVNKTPEDQDVYNIDKVMEVIEDICFVQPELTLNIGL